jgi:hypothetical protein
MEQSLSSAVVSVTKKVLVDFINKHLWLFNGLNKFQNKTKEELYALIALHSESSLYYLFLQETKGIALQSIKSKQKRGTKSVSSLQHKYTTKPPSDKDIELEQAVNDLEIYDVFRLLEEGANPNMLSTKRDNSLLGTVILRNYKDEEEKEALLQIAELLLHYGSPCAITNGEDNREQPKNIELLEMLLHHGVHPDAIVPNIPSSTTLLIRYLLQYDNKNYFNHVKLLIDFGADVMKQDVNCVFPLKQACDLCVYSPEILHYMLQHSVFDTKNLDATNPWNRDLMNIVCSRVNEDDATTEEIICLLVAKGININEVYIMQDVIFKNPLYIALNCEKFKLAKTLLQHGASVYDIVLQRLKKYETQHQWLLQYMRENNLSVVPYQPVNDKESIDNLQLLPSILPTDIRQHIWNIKEQLEYECEPQSCRTFSIEYTIPYINHRLQAIKFAAENSSYSRCNLSYCKSFSTTIQTSVDNYTYGYRFKTTFYRVLNLNEDKMNYYIDFLTKVWGATDIRHIPMFILRHGKSGYICDTFMYEEIQPIHITQKVNEIVNKCVELLRLQKVKFHEVSHRETQREWLMGTINRLKKVLNQDDKSIYDILQQVEPYKVLTKTKKGIHLVSIDEKSTIVGYDWEKSWETYIINISPEEDEYNYVKHLNKELQLTSKAEYVDSANIHKHYIEDPVKYFSKHAVWKGWYDFLGIDTSRFLKTKKEWIDFCKSKNIRSYKDYMQHYIHYQELPEFPDELYNTINIMLELGQCKRRPL